MILKNILIIVGENTLDTTIPMNIYLRIWLISILSNGRRGFTIFFILPLK